MLTRQSLIRRGFRTLCLAIILVMPSCNGTLEWETAPPYPDECFAPGGRATYWDGRAFLEVTYNEGSISASGSPPRGSDWEILSFTGEVVELGRAEGTATVWLFTEDGERRAIDFSLVLTLNDGTSCAERDRLSYSFHEIALVEGAYLPISGEFAGVREVR
jgi:hypothetical protein